MEAVRRLGAHLLICISIALTSVIAQNSYLFIAPKTIRPGNDLTIQGSLLVNPFIPVTVTAYLEKSTQQEPRFGFIMEPEPPTATKQPEVPPEPYSTARVTFSDTQPRTITLPVPDTLLDQKYQLRIEGSGGLLFDNITQLDFDDKRFSIFIQTDKAIYKPGQTVHFRIFGVNSDLKVLFEPMSVDLYDPAGNKINQWNVAAKELQDAAGVFESQMVMAEEPVLGDWKLDVKMGKEKAEKTFTIDEYVLPKFEVSLDLPPFGRSAEREFQGGVTAKYTYGKPVKGVADVRIRSKWPQFNWINNTRVKVSKDVELQFPINGEAKFTIPMSQLKDANRFLDRSYLVFEANVTETLTGAKLKAPEEELQFFDKIIKMEYPSSLPNNFKPGLSYTAVVKVSEQDGSPPSVTTGTVDVMVTFYKPMVPTTTSTTTTTTTPSTPPEPIMVDGQLVFPVIEPEIMPKMIMPPRPDWHWPRDEEIKQPPMNLTLPADGMVEIPLDIPAGITSVSIEARYNGISAYKSIDKSHSPSDSYLQLRLLNEKPKTGDTAGIQVRSTDPLQTEADYQVLSKGNIVASGRVDLVSGILNFPITANMAPKAKVMVFYVREDGEVVADGLTFNVEGIFDNQVAINFDKATAQPADKISLSVTADPGSKVNVLAVDKSVLLLKSGNDISHDDVKKELQSYDSNDRRGPVCDWFCWRWPMPASGDDAKSVFDNAGLVYITDALVYDHVEHWQLVDIVFDAMPMMDMGVMDVLGRFAAGAPPPSPKAMQTPTRVRKLFPETWLWNTQTIPTNGTAVFESTVPDTITSWVATAFAVHPDSGLGLSESAANLKTFMPFFLSLHMPYSVVRGEKLILQANVFNYSPFPLFAYVLLKRNPDFENVHISPYWSSQYSADVARFVMVQPDSAAAVYFPIVPKTLGKIKLSLEARSLYAADAIEKELLVEPEGTPEEYNVPVLIDLKQKPSFTTTIPVSFPPATVPGSQRVRVTAIGDLMGPSINGLDSLIKMPYGCGEQNMLNFAPNIFVTRYLELTNNLDVQLFEKSKNYMQKGYQREMTYRHDDGSFSAFGNSDPSGSMWLTAFVLKSFVQAKPYLFIDDAVIQKAVTWILKHQNSNGTFQEPGKVLHKEMQGGSISSESSLTAFVLVALLEARVVEGVNTQIQEAVALATGHLEREVANMTDTYELAITTYALTLAGSPQAQVAMDKLMAISTMEGGMRYWKKPQAADTNLPAWQKPNSKAINVELSAYGLLALAAANNREDGLLVLKYLTSQRNPNGGYSSTQDTIVALQGLSEMASQVYSRDFNVSVDVTGPPDSFVLEKFTVTPDNALVLQSRELPHDIGSVTVSASGTGLSLVEVGVFYNIDRDDSPPSFDLKVTLPEESINHYIVQVCTSYLKEGASAMSVIEIGYPSGFSADKTSIDRHPLLKRTEDGDKKVILYLDEIGKTEMCFKVLMERSGLVAGAQPVPVKVYDYYEPADHVTTFYVPEVLRTSDVCDVCGKECDFCNQERQPLWRGRG